MRPFDAHTHIGANDPDGFKQTPAELMDVLSRVDARAAVFPMHEPDGYPAANDAALAAAEASNGRLYAFARIEAAERDQPAVGLRCLREHHVVGGRVAVGLVHREDERSGVDPLERPDELLARARVLVGIVESDVRVGVEDVLDRHRLPQLLEPGQKCEV
jgi:hypothetical protein